MINFTSPKQIMFLALLFLFSFTANAQHIQLVPNPATLAQGDYTGYYGFPIVYNNGLYVLFQNDAANGYKKQLAKYNGPTAPLTVIPNPDNGTITDPPYFITYNSKLYFSYTNTDGNKQLAQFDGTTVTVIPNPTNGSDIMGKGIEFNNKLYYFYQSSGSGSMVQFDGTSYTNIPNPPNGIPAPLIVYNNTLITIFYNTVTGQQQLAKYDGNTITVIPFPIAGNFGGFPMLYNNKLYYYYVTPTYKFHLAQYDGTSVTVFPNFSDADLGFTNGEGPIIYNNDLCLLYTDSTYRSSLALFDGTSFSLVPNPSGAEEGSVQTNYSGRYNDLPITSRAICNNKLYVGYYNQQGNSQLYEYDGTNAGVIDNPTTIPDNSGAGSFGKFLPYNNKLYFSYSSYDGVTWGSNLAEYDGSLTRIAANPDGGSMGGTLFIYNDTLFTQYYNETQNTQLAFFVPPTVLPLKLISFTGRSANGITQLQWQTATEQNTGHFEIERSADGKDFSFFSNVKAVGSGNNTYSAFDEHPLAGNNYYRLRSVNTDGTYATSNIVLISASSNNKFTIYPNPASDRLIVTNSVGTNDATISILSATGQKLLTTSTNGQLKTIVDISSLSAGSYFIQYNSRTTTQQEKFIKMN